MTTIEDEVKWGFLMALEDDPSEATLATWLKRYPEWETWLRRAWELENAPDDGYEPTAAELAHTEGILRAALHRALAERDAVAAQEAAMQQRFTEWQGR